MAHDGSSSPPSRGSWWAVVFWLSLFSLLLLASFHARGQELNESNDRRTSIEASLTDSLSASAELRQALSERKASRLDLEIAYAALKIQLQTSHEKLQSRIEELTKQLNDSVTLSDDLRAEIKRLTMLLTESKQESEALSRAFEVYRTEMQGQVTGLERQNKMWRIITGVLAAATMAATVWAALR